MVFVVIFLFGNRLQARFRYLLWCVVLLRLVMPVPPVASWGIFAGHESTAQLPLSAVENNDVPLMPEDANPSVTTLENEMYVAAQPIEPPGIELPLMVVSEMPFATEAVEIATSETGVPFWKFSVLLAWSIGVVLFGVRYVCDEWQFARQSRDWRPVDDPAILQLLQQCRREVGLWRPVRFLVVPQDIGAASTGFWRSSVLISQTALDVMTPEQLRMILLHELVHLKRWDPAVLRLASLLRVIYWPHPVVWFVFSRLQRDREPACDATVLHILGQHKTAAEIRSNQSLYGKTVLLFAQRVSPERRLPGLVGASLNDRRHNILARRIDMILKHKRGTILQAALGILLVVTITAFGLTRAAEKSPSKTLPDDHPAITESLTTSTVFIRGTVINPENKPVKGAFVRTRSRLAKLVVTDDNGRFEFPAPEQIYASMPFYATLPGTDLVAYHHLPHIPECAAELPELTITLEKGRRFFGKVVDESGKPIEGGYVGASEQSLTTEPVLTDKDGNFEFYFPQRRTFDLFAIKPGVGFDFIGVEMKNHVATDEPLKPEVGPLTLTLTKTDPVSIHLEDENGKPVQGIRVQPWLLYKPDGSITNVDMNCDSCLAQQHGLFFTESDENGVAVIDWLPKGLGWNRETRSGLRESAMLTEIHVFSDPRAKDHYTAASPLKWQPGVTKLVTKLVKVVPIEGSVRLADGTPVPFASLSYGYSEGGNGWSFADPSGRFTFHLASHKIMGIVVESNLGAAPAAFDIDAGDGSNPPRVDFVLQNGTKFYGRVIAGDGSVPYRTNLTLTEYAPGEKRGGKGIFRCIWTDENGNFETRLPRGHYDVQTWLPSPGNRQSDRRTLEITDETEKRMDFRFPDNRSVKITSPTGEVNALSDLDQTGTTVTGRITLPPLVKERFTSRDWAYNQVKLFHRDANDRLIERKADLMQSPVDSQTGLFRCEKVSPGHWSFSAEIAQAPKDSDNSGKVTPPLATFFSVAAIPEQETPFEIGLVPQIFEMNSSSTLVFEDEQWRNDTTDETLPPGTQFRHEQGVYILHVEKNGYGFLELLAASNPAERSAVGSGKHIVFTCHGINVSALTPTEMKNVLVMSPDDTFVFDNGRWTNEKNGEAVEPGTIVTGTRGGLRLLQKDDDASVELIAGAGVSGQGRYIRLYNGGESIETRFYNSADRENSMEMTMDDVFLFENGQWIHQKTGVTIAPGTIVRGTRGLFRLNVQDGIGSIELISGSGSLGSGKSIRWSHGGNATSGG